MGFINYKRGLQIGIHKETNFSGYKTNSCQYRKRTYYAGRNRFFNAKKCYRNRTENKLDDRFLQYSIFSQEKDRRFKTSHKSKTSKSVPPKATFQDGHIDKSVKSSSKERLGDIFRLKRRLFSHRHIQETQKIPQICMEGESFPIQNIMFRTNCLSTSFHKNIVSCCSLSKSKSHTISSVSGRLDTTESRKTNITNRKRDNAQSSTESRFHNKQKQIHSHSCTDSDIFRNSFSIKERPGLSNGRKISEISEGNSSTNQWLHKSKTIFGSSWNDGIHTRNCTKCKTVYETPSNAFVTKLESSQNVSALGGPMYTVCEIQSPLVVTSSQFSKRGVFATNSTADNNDLRCINGGMGWFCEQPSSTGCLVQEPEYRAYKLSGIEGGTSVIGKFCSDIKEQTCIDSIGQFQHSSIFEQTGRYKIDETLRISSENLVPSSTPQYEIEISTYQGADKCISGFSQPTPTSVYRMVTEQDCSEPSVLDVGDSANRFVCDSREQTMSSVLLMESRYISTDTGCSVHKLGRHDGICISTHKSVGQGTQTHDEVSVRIDSDSTNVGTSALVSNDSSVVDSSTSQASRNGRFIGSERDVTSESKTSKTDCMEIIDKRYETEGFSRQTRKLLCSSWRIGTQKDYRCKFRKFHSWCGKRQIDPFSPSLNNCANFLADLYKDGLKYKTISGYRSMMSSMLNPVDRIPVGQHPYIIRLLKGIFNERPPVKRLVPEWNLLFVLDALKQPPFEPIKTASLKYVTYKTVFLIAITTFRRCGDLQSLTLGENSVNVQAKGVTFIRHGLSKQDRGSHQSNTIFIPAFPKNKLLDPKRALTYYLKSTEKFRNSKEKDSLKLFLTVNKPHRAASSQTISSWIVKTIQKSYKMKKVYVSKVKGHSTRSIGPSWALFKGAPLKDVLDSADWSRSSTFVKFYFKDVSFDFLKE